MQSFRQSGIRARWQSGAGQLGKFARIRDRSPEHRLATEQLSHRKRFHP